MRKISKFLNVAFGFLLLFGSNPAFAKFENSIVNLVTSRAPVDIARPWQIDKVVQHENLAAVVKGGLLLTTAYAVHSATTLELQKLGDPRKFAAEVVFVDFEVNLALVRPKSKEFLTGLVPIKIGNEINIGADVSVYRAKDSYQLTKMPGHLSEVGIYNVITSSYSMLAYLVKVQQKGLGWAEPIFKNGSLVGITSGQDTNFIHAIPSITIQHFLNDRHNENYRGFPSIGVGLSPLVDPTARRYYGADKIKGGIRISKIQEGSSFFGKLQVDDVLYSLNGHSLSEHGYFRHPRWGQVHMKFLLNKMYSGDRIDLKIIRKGKPISIKGTATKYRSNDYEISYNRYGAPEPHLIFGGLIIQELTREYLEQWGSDWQRRASFDLLYQYNFNNEPNAKSGKKQIILGGVLADEFNRGYQKLRHLVISKINGEAVSSLEEVRKALKDSAIDRFGRQFAKFQFIRDGGEAILGYEGIEQAHERIAKSYQINSPDSFWSR